MIVIFWICIALFVLLVFLHSYMFLAGRILERDKKNPYTFYCKKCGQMYITIGELGTHRYDYLEHNGTIYDENCKCHSLTEPRRKAYGRRWM